jgi:hypothetical protein
LFSCVLRGSFFASAPRARRPVAAVKILEYNMLNNNGDATLADAEEERRERPIDIPQNQYLCLLVGSYNPASLHSNDYRDANRGQACTVVLMVPGLALSRIFASVVREFVRGGVEVHSRRLKAVVANQV